MANDTPTYTLKDQDYLDLWKFFNEDTAKIKDKLWTIASWLYALMSGLMGFIVKYKIDHEGPDKCLLALMALTGLLLSLYCSFMIEEYGWHIKRGWKVTDFLMDKIGGLQTVWDSKKNTGPTGIYKLMYGKDNGKGLPPFVHRLLWLAWMYGLGFIGLFVFSIWGQ